MGRPPITPPLPYTTLFRSEGTTQQLSDFDRVYVQLDAPVGTARLGDVDLAYTDGVFASLTRKIQGADVEGAVPAFGADRKSTRLNSSHVKISYAVFCMKSK